jgi:hypothetical protein
VIIAKVQDGNLNNTHINIYLWKRKNLKNVKSEKRGTKMNEELTNAVIEVLKGYPQGSLIQYPEIRKKLDYRYPPRSVSRTLYKLCDRIGRDSDGHYTVYRVR